MKFFFKITKYRLNFPNICIKIDKRNILRTKEHGAGSFGFVQNICIQTIISAQACIGCIQQLFCLDAKVVALNKGVKKMQDKNNTQYFKVEKEQQIRVDDVLEIVYSALREKGYNPVNQIVGYIMSGDPTYITSHRNARSLIMKVERDELVEEILRRYIQSNSWG